MIKTVKMARFFVCLGIVMLATIALMPVLALAADTPTPTVTTTSTNVTATPSPSPTATTIAVATPTPTPAPTLPPENLTINPTYPRVEASVGGKISFECKIVFDGYAPKVFDLQARGPAGWDVYINPQYDAATKISSIRVEPSFAGTTVNVVASAVVFPLPDPGDYKITLTASSGTLKASYDLVAKIVPAYRLTLVSATDQTAMTAKSGQDNFFSVKVQNMGTAPIDQIKFTEVKPQGWTVSYSPSVVDSLAYFDEKAVDVNIKPAANTPDGDYIVSLTAEGTQSKAQQLDIRVSVVSESIWRWVGVIAIAVLIIGACFGFLKYIKR